MKQSRFTETQIVIILKEADECVPPEELCRKNGIIKGTYYKGKANTPGWTHRRSNACRS